MMDYIQELSGLTRFINWDLNLRLSTGIVKGRRAYEKYLVKPLKGIGFDNLNIPLYIIAADILTGDEIIFNSGSLPDAIRASASVPVLSSPWHYQGRYLSDGGIVNPLPANVLREHGADIVLASSVIQPLKKSYSGAKDKMPNMLQSIFNIFSAMEAEVVEKQFPFIDILIQHNISARSTLDFENVDDMIRSGEDAARQALPQIQKIIETPPAA
jgi:NTE family protein